MTAKGRVPAAEARLWDQAEELSDFDDLASLTGELLDAAQAAGVDPRVVPGLQATLQLLSPGADTTYDPEKTAGRGGFRDDLEMIEAVVDTEFLSEDHLTEITRLKVQVRDAADDADRDLDVALAAIRAARAALRAALAMVVREPCNGCHGMKQSAIMQATADLEDAEDAADEAQARLDLCADTMEVLDEAGDQLTRALECLRHVIPDLSETFDLLTEYVRGGGKLAANARQWHTGLLNEAV